MLPPYEIPQIDLGTILITVLVILLSVTVEASMVLQNHGPTLLLQLEYHILETYLNMMSVVT